MIERRDGILNRIKKTFHKTKTLTEAVAALGDMRRKQKTSALVSLSVSDLLNLMGIVTPGRRVSSHYRNGILYGDGISVAFKEGAETGQLSKFDRNKERSVR